MIETLMLTCLDNSDPRKPRPFRARARFNPESPLEIQFDLDLDAPNGPQRWLAARQLVADGMEAVLLTGLGDFRCRSNADRFIIQLADAESGYRCTLELPREQVRFVMDEAEALCPLADACMEPSDEELAAWLTV